MHGTRNERFILRHLRGVFPVARLLDARARLDAVFAALNRSGDTPRETAAIGRGETSDAIRLDRAWFEVWREPAAELQQAVAGHTLVLYPPQVRVMREPAHLVPWHQDIAYQRLLGERAHARLITCFIPLEDEPARHATIQFSRRRVPEQPHATMAGFGAGIEPDRDPEPFHYELDLGDALIFSELVLHRSFVPDRADPRRRSLEFRLVQPADSLAVKDYFDIGTGSFVRGGGEG